MLSHLNNVLGPKRYLKGRIKIKEPVTTFYDFEH